MNKTTRIIRSEEITIDAHIFTVLAGGRNPGEIYFAAIAPDMELTVVKEEEMFNILPCFDGDDAYINLPGTSLLLVYNPAQVLKLAGKRHLTGPAVLMRMNISQYTCSQYSKVPVGKLCKTQHRINEDVVLSLVSEMLKAIAEYAKHDRAEFVRVVQEAQSSQQTVEVRKQRTRLAAAKQRVSELEVLLCKIYEDTILGKLSDSRYATLDAQYEKEQSELTAEISVQMCIRDRCKCLFYISE